MDYNICRLCLIPKRTDHPKFKNIFTTFGNFNNREIKIIDAIVECAPIQIKEKDNFPKDICVNCLEKLQNSYEFREICVQSDLKLKSLSVIKKQEPTDNGSDLSDSHHDYDDLYDQENEKTIKEELIIEEEFGIAEHVLTPESKSNDVKHENSSTESNRSNEDEATCNECGKKFLSVKSYHRHLKQNHAHEFIKCMHCNRKFPNNVDLNLHNEKFHTFRCTICNETFVSEIQIEKHYIVIHFSTYVKETDDEKNNSNLCYICGEEKTHLVNHSDCRKGMEKPRKTYKCKECEKNFTSSWSLNNHLLTHTGEKPFTCDFCNKSFRQKIILSVHRRIHTGETPFSCEICNKSFRQKMHLSLHRLIHTDENNYVCDLCSESFSTNTCLTNHKKEAHQESNDGSKKSIASFQCSSCGKSFKQKRYLMVHIKNGHTEDKRHICEICSATFITKLNLKRHMTIHKEKPAIIGDRSPFPCNSCGKGFTSKQEHSEHIRLHAGEYAFVCDTCGDVFKAGDALRKHKLLKHTEDKAHHCTICSKEFARKDQLRLHLAVHNDDLPHKCGLCPKRFKWRVGLWRHKKSHTGELPYKCSVCNKGFIEAVKLRRHLRVHTGERPYKCEICFQSFPQSSTLKTHMNVHKN